MGISRTDKLQTDMTTLTAVVNALQTTAAPVVKPVKPPKSLTTAPKAGGDAGSTLPAGAHLPNGSLYLDQRVFKKSLSATQLGSFKQTATGDTICARFNTHWGCSTSNCPRAHVDIPKSSLDALPPASQAYACSNLGWKCAKKLSLDDAVKGLKKFSEKSSS